MASRRSIISIIISIISETIKALERGAASGAAGGAWGLPPWRAAHLALGPAARVQEGAGPAVPAARLDAPPLRQEFLHIISQHKHYN